jgi:hypothetical protein
MTPPAKSKFLSEAPPLPLRSGWRLPSAMKLLLPLLAFCAGTACALEPIRISPDGKSFVQGEPGKPFRVWGVNYDHDSTGKNGRLLEDYWIGEWDTVRSDFAEMKELGSKPLVIKETFPLECGLEEMDDFLKRSRPCDEGYISFYWGRTIKEYAAAKEDQIAAAIMGGWLKQFQKLALAMKQPD